MRVELSVDRLLTASALRWGEKTAVSAPDGEISYSALEKLASRAARHLRTLGVQPGQRVGVALGSSTAYIVWFFAVSRAGAVLVPLNPAYSPAEFSHIVVDAEVALVICENQLFEAFNEMALELGARFRVLSAPDIATVADLVAAHTDSTFASIDDWMQPHSILYTSGTTGRPKGAIHAHRSRIANTLSGQLGYGITSATRMISAAPMFHSGGIVLGIINVLAAGGTLIVPKDAHIDTLKQHMLVDSVNFVLTAPTVIYRMVMSDDFCSAVRDVDFSVLHGAAPISPSTVARLLSELPKCRPYHCYGSTEMSQASVLPPDEYYRFPTVTGRALPGVDLRVVDEAGAIVAKGDVGEVVTSGPHLFLGYLNDVDKTAAALRDGLHHTGDLATVNEYGHISVVGRKSDMIISGGYNVYPAEVEGVLEQHAAVEQAAVFGIPSDEWGEEVCAAVLLKPGVHSDFEALKRHCQNGLARYKHPKRIFFVTDFPRTAVGKIQKAELRKKFAL